MGSHPIPGHQKIGPAAWLKSDLCCAAENDQEFEDALGVFVKQLALDGFARREFADGGDGACALATGTAANRIVAVTAVDQLVLVALEKSAGEVFVAIQGVQA